MTRFLPNSFQKPNLYTDKLMHLLTGDEWKTLDYALRRTFGFNKEADRISVSQFMSGNGRLDEFGQPVEYGTGLSRPAQIQALNELMRFGILIEVAPNNTANHGRMWLLQLDERQVQFDLMRDRAAAKQERGRTRTAAARQSRVPEGLQADADAGMSDIPGLVSPTYQPRLVGHTSAGQSDIPALVSPTNPQKPSKKPSRNPEETQSSGEAGAPVAEAWHALLNLCRGDAERAAAVWRLQQRFAVVTQLKQPDAQSSAGRRTLIGEWWPYLLQVLAEADDDLATAEAAMHEAFRSMTQRETPLNVVGPRSIAKVAAGVIAGRRRGVAAGAGGAAGGTLQQRPKGLRGIDAYAERRGINGN